MKVNEQELSDGWKALSNLSFTSVDTFKQQDLIYPGQTDSSL